MPKLSVHEFRFRPQSSVCGGSKHNSLLYYVLARFLKKSKHSSMYIKRSEQGRIQYIFDSEGLRIIASLFWFGELWYKWLGKPLFSLGCSEKQAMNAFSAITWTIRGVTSALYPLRCHDDVSPTDESPSEISWAFPSSDDASYERFVPWTKRPSLGCCFPDRYVPILERLQEVGNLISYSKNLGGPPGETHASLSPPPPPFETCTASSRGRNVHEL